MYGWVVCVVVLGGCCGSLVMDDTLFRCTVCGRIGLVGRCCGEDTREPLNDLAREEVVIEKERKVKDASFGV